jgi:hypothetical protein
VSRRRRLLLDLTKQAKFCNSKKWGKRISTIAARRGGAPIQFFELRSRRAAIFAIHRNQYCRSPRRGANSIPNFKEIENWENDAIFATSISLKLGLQKMTSFSQF